MTVNIEHIEWPDRPDVMMPYAPAIKVTGGKSVEAAGGTLANIVHCKRFLTDLNQQDILNRIWNEYMGKYKPTSTTVQVQRLATDPRCLVEIDAIAVVDD
jgi:enamine deaminase RidA (YjgF/YER057c/UK114 family)